MREHPIPIPIPLDAIAEFCQRNHIRKLSLFGSVLRDDFGPESDVDVLVEFEEGKTPGLGFVSVMDGLTELLGREVDLVTPGSVEPGVTGDRCLRLRQSSAVLPQQPH